MPDGQQNSSVSAPGSVETPKYIVPGLQRGLEILRTFSRDRYSIGAPELARELNIPRSTVFRLIQTLEYMGFLEKLENGSEYRLSVGVLSLGFEFIASLEVTDLARPLLKNSGTKRAIPCTSLSATVATSSLLSKRGPRAPLPAASISEPGCQRMARCWVGLFWLTCLTRNLMRFIRSQPCQSFPLKHLKTWTI